MSTQSMSISPEMTLGEFAALLQADLRTRSITAYDALRTLLTLAGAGHVDHSYQVAPKACPRTLRRAFSQGVLMCLDVSLQENKNPSDTLKEEELSELQMLAREAKVPAEHAITAMLRFGNPLTRVKQVLVDIRALIVHGGKVTNPPGLFIKTMRSGEDVKLPQRVQAVRDQEQTRKAVQGAAGAIQVGEWLKVDGDWLRVEAVTPGMVELYAPLGYHYLYVYPESETNVTMDRAVRLQRRSDPPN